MHFFANILMMHAVTAENTQSTYIVTYGKGCRNYIPMDDKRYGRPGGQYTVDQCAAAVKRLDGHEGCKGKYFFFESAGYCNCPTDDCTTSPNLKAGSGGQLYEFEGYEAAKVVAPLYHAVQGKGCTNYVQMDDKRYGRPGGQYTADQCAAAVKKLDGHEGCKGKYFFFESSGYCNCPTDDCTTSANMNAGSGGQLYAFNDYVAAKVVSLYHAVQGKGCTSYVQMDDKRYGRKGGQYTADQCAAAVKKLDGHEGCKGKYFFFESSGYCNCPKDDCTTSPNLNAGSFGQLFEFKKKTAEQSYTAIHNKWCQGRNELFESKLGVFKSADECKKHCTDNPKCVSAEWFGDSPTQCDTSSSCTTKIMTDAPKSYNVILFVKGHGKPLRRPSGKCPAGYKRTKKNLFNYDKRNAQIQYSVHSLAECGAKCNARVACRAFESNGKVCQTLAGSSSTPLIDSALQSGGWTSCLRNQNDVKAHHCPSGYKYNQRNLLNDDKRNDQVVHTVNSITECGTLCDERLGCRAFESNGRTCQTITGSSSTPVIDYTTMQGPGWMSCLKEKACVPPQGEPTFQGSPFFDGSGKDKSAYASKVCAFLGLAKAKTQPETQVKDSHRENLKSIWVPDGCKYYRAGRRGSLSWTYGNQKTINGATWCLGTYNKMHNDPTWGRVRCECTDDCADKTLKNDHIRCGNGEVRSDWKCGKARGYRVACPPNFPFLCAKKNDCGGGIDQCCSKDCVGDKRGGNAGCPYRLGYRQDAGSIFNTGGNDGPVVVHGRKLRSGENTEFTSAVQKRF